jgi:hypothetical protein
MVESYYSTTTLFGLPILSDILMNLQGGIYQSGRLRYRMSLRQLRSGIPASGLPGRKLYLRWNTWGRPSKRPVMSTLRYSCGTITGIGSGNGPAKVLHTPVQIAISPERLITGIQGTSMIRFARWQKHIRINFSSSPRAV